MNIEDGKCLLTPLSRPFGARWWFWLAMTGVGLGLTVSCKWVGLFTIATIGCSTVLDLWKLLGNLHVSQVIICSITYEKEQDWRKETKE